jgi:hypothetical protein
MYFDNLGLDEEQRSVMLESVRAGRVFILLCQWLSKDGNHCYLN